MLPLFQVMVHQRVAADGNRGKYYTLSLCGINIYDKNLPVFKTCQGGKRKSCVCLTEHIKHERFRIDNSRPKIRGNVSPECCCRKTKAVQKMRGIRGPALMEE